MNVNAAFVQWACNAVTDLKVRVRLPAGALAEGVISGGIRGIYETSVPGYLFIDVLHF